uniref:Uncharacterized protein n=1 Tax=Magnetococcus massalia (strain MO-1) TaxID=451514 RepID=A0A1S7LEJ8_MAGMO|nr:exported protein of unknown function [Candidatus Magnetococcus massalia]
MRVILVIILVGFALALGWVAFSKLWKGTHPEVIEGEVIDKPEPDWTENRLIRALIAAALTILLISGLMRLTISPESPGKQDYKPAQIIDGKVVQGEVK